MKMRCIARRGRLFPKGTFVVLACLHTLVGSFAQAEQAMTSVQASDLLHRVQVIGTLGQPIGTLVKVKGQWHGPGRRKSAANRFVISHVNNRPVNGIEFEHSAVNAALRGGRPTDATERYDWIAREMRVVAAEAPQAVVDEKWELEAYEWGQFTGYPPKVWKEYKSPVGPKRQLEGGRYEFKLELRFIKLRRLPQTK